jgi:hypothetical protein
MNVLINITTVFIAMIVLAAVFRQVGRSSLRNWLCSTASAAESASTKSTEAEWVPVRDASLVIPANSSIDFSGLWPSHPAGASGRVMARDSQDDRLAENISKLRLAAVISAQNQTNASARVYQSDTNEILVDAPQRLARVITPRREIGDPLEVAADGSRLTFTLDNAATSHGPTTFFRLDRRSNGRQLNAMEMRRTCIKTRIASLS